jgi:hypothetical protein
MQSTPSSPISGMPIQRQGGVVRGTGGFSIIGLPIALIIGAIGAVAIGVALFYSGKVIYLIFVSVILAAALAGSVAVIAVAVGKIRNNLVAFILGALIGLTMYGTYRVAEYLDFLQVSKDEIRAGDSSYSDADMDRVIEFVLRSETGDAGFIGFTKYMAQEGFSVTRATSSSSTGIDIKDGLAWGYWGLEVLIVVFTGGLMAITKSKMPYCTEESRWLKYKISGEVIQPNLDYFMGAFKNNDLRAAAQMLQPMNNKSPLPKLLLEVGRCNDQTPDGIVKITLVSKNAKNQTSSQVLFDGDVSQVNQLLNR